MKAKWWWRWSKSPAKKFVYHTSGEIEVFDQRHYVFAHKPIFTRSKTRNIRGQHVLVVRCECGWTHMTVYDFLGYRKALNYLQMRYRQHIKES